MRGLPVLAHLAILLRDAMTGVQVEYAAGGAHVDDEIEAPLQLRRERVESVRGGGRAPREVRPQALPRGVELGAPSIGVRARDGDIAVVVVRDAPGLAQEARVRDDLRRGSTRAGRRRAARREESRGLEHLRGRESREGMRGLLWRGAPLHGVELALRSYERTVRHAVAHGVVRSPPERERRPVAGECGEPHQALRRIEMSRLGRDRRAKLRDGRAKCAVAPHARTRNRRVDARALVRERRGIRERNRSRAALPGVVRGNERGPRGSARAGDVVHVQARATHHRSRGPAPRGGSSAARRARGWRGRPPELDANVTHEWTSPI